MQEKLTVRIQMNVEEQVVEGLDKGKENQTINSKGIL